MNKSELRKLRTLNATREMMEKALKNDGKFEGISKWSGYKWTCKRKYGYFMRCQQLNGIIKVAVFNPENMKKGIRTAKYEIFINPDGKEYITRILDDAGKEVKWSNAMFCNIEPNKWQYLNECVNEAYMNPEGSRKIKNSLNTQKGAYEGIKQYQQRCLENKNREAEKRQLEPWDKEMKLIPKIPERFKKWMEKEVPSEHYIFYQYRRGGAKEGYCTYCHKMVPLAVVPKHRADGKCAVCKKKIEYISQGKLHTLWTGRDQGELVQKIRGGLVVRIFYVTHDYNTSNQDKTKVIMRETDRWIFRSKTRSHYEWDVYKNRYTRWCKKSELLYTCRDERKKVYTGNMASIEKTAGRYTAIHIMARSGVNMPAEDYLWSEQVNPALEKLAKIGMTKLAGNLINAPYKKELISKEQTELTKILKIDKGRLNRLKKIDSGVTGLRWMQLEKERNTEYDDDMIKYFDTEKVEPERLEFLKDTGMSYKKIQNYIIRQQSISPERVSQMLISWRDYLQMAENAKMRVEKEKIYKPENLKVAHADMISLLNQDKMEKQAQERLEQFPNINEVCKTLGKYEWSDKEYIITAPKDILDIIREGTVLQHCIHTCDYYFDRINNKEAYLLFLRRKEQPDTPWYTLEVEPGGNIRQKRTTGDTQDEDLNQAVKFLKKWQKVIQKRLSDEDKKLAQESERKRKENYNNLRKNGNRIWHGKLQGKLLVDVLEQDFMEVI